MFFSCDDAVDARVESGRDDARRITSSDVFGNELLIQFDTEPWPLRRVHPALRIARAIEGNLALELAVQLEHVVDRQRAAILLNEPGRPIIGDQ